MTASIAEIMEKIYASLKNDNQDLDAYIHDLKGALAAGGQKSIAVEPARLMQNNRQGRKTMQSYFRKRGVAITFSEP